MRGIKKLMKNTPGNVLQTHWPCRRSSKNWELKTKWKLLQKTTWDWHEQYTQHEQHCFNSIPFNPNLPAYKTHKMMPQELEAFGVRPHQDSTFMSSSWSKHHKMKVLLNTRTYMHKMEWVWKEIEEESQSLGGCDMPTWGSFSSRKKAHRVAPP